MNTYSAKAVVEQLRGPVVGDMNWLWGQLEHSGWVKEQLSWKETCYIGDWSFIWQKRFSGPDALRLLSDHSVNSFEKFELWQAKHLSMCDDNGKIIHEGIAIREGEDQFMIYALGCYYLEWRAQRLGYDVTVETLEGYSLQVSGPNALKTLEKASGTTLRDIKFMHVGHIEIAGTRVGALRQGMAGEVGFELIGPMTDRDKIHAAVMDAGEEFGIEEMGARVAMINHLEACFPTIGWDYIPAIFGPDMVSYVDKIRTEIPGLLEMFIRIKGSFESDDPADWYRSPVELNWGRNIKFDHEFRGRKALEEEVATPRRKMVTLEWNANDVIDVYASAFDPSRPMYTPMEIPRDMRGHIVADSVLNADGDVVGVTTSRGYSVYFRRMLSLCTIDVAHAEPGTEVVVVWGDPGTPQKQVRATVAPAPYKEDNRRADLTATV
ncbi:hypothetical protein [Gordonia terrae]|uniref:hypothetical protein n=1 Tax=Gordonia terrae TaxID=2055 RepID=UPI003F6D9F34